MYIFPFCRNGSPVRVPDKVTSLVEEVMTEMGMTKEKQRLVKTYTVYGFDPFHAGTTLLFSGGILGLPVNFKYSSVEEFDPSGITVSTAKVLVLCGENLCTEMIGDLKFYVYFKGEKKIHLLILDLHLLLFHIKLICLGLLFLKYYFIIFSNTVIIV